MNGSRGVSLANQMSQFCLCLQTYKRPVLFSVEFWEWVSLIVFTIYSPIPNPSQFWTNGRFLRTGGHGLPVYPVD
jgi:hypothetical protein